MQWLRNWLGGRPHRPTATPAAPPHPFRPQVEALDERCMPSVSSVLTDAYGLTQFVVDSSNSLRVTLMGSTSTVIDGATTPVRTAQGFRTAGGLLGFDAVLADGTVRHLEQGGGSVLPNGTYTAADFGLAGRILDVGEAYDAQGRLRFDIVTTAGPSTALGATGTLFEYNQAAGGGLRDVGLGSNVRWVGTYLDPLGGTGIAVGQAIPATATALAQELVRKLDASTGLTTLYDGAGGVTAAVTDFAQTVSPRSVGGTASSTSNAKVITDITFNADTSLATTTDLNRTYALEYTSGPGGVVGVVVVSNGNTIKPGG